MKKEDRGACPFDCCVYRTWNTKADTVVYAEPKRNARIVGLLKAGAAVEAVTGEVHAKPVPFLVKRWHGEHKPGDLLWVSTYFGEGHFRVWWNGTMHDADLGFNRCESPLRTRGSVHRNASVVESRPVPGRRPSVHLADPIRLQARVNADPEFRLAARYWNATLSLESPSRALRVEIVDGQVTSCRESVAGQPATITMVAPDNGWAQFLAAVPRPFYQDLIGGCVQHHGFQVTGNILSLSAYYQAAMRLFTVMRALRATPGKES